MALLRANVAIMLVLLIYSLCYFGLIIIPVFYDPYITAQNAKYWQENTLKREETRKPRKKGQNFLFFTG